MMYELKLLKTFLTKDNYFNGEEPKVSLELNLTEHHWQFKNAKNAVCRSLCIKERDIAWRFSYCTGRKLGGDGQPFPIKEHHRVSIKLNGDWTGFLIIVWQSSVSRFRSE